MDCSSWRGGTGLNNKSWFIEHDREFVRPQSDTTACLALCAASESELEHKLVWAPECRLHFRRRIQMERRLFKVHLCSIEKSTISMTRLKIGSNKTRGAGRLIQWSHFCLFIVTNAIDSATEQGSLQEAKTMKFQTNTQNTSHRSFIL